MSAVRLRWRRTMPPMPYSLTDERHSISDPDKINCVNSLDSMGTERTLNQINLAVQSVDVLPQQNTGNLQVNDSAEEKADLSSLTTELQEWKEKYYRLEMDKQQETQHIESITKENLALKSKLEDKIVDVVDRLCSETVNTALNVS
jgi:hypothetical protein